MSGLVRGAPLLLALSAMGLAPFAADAQAPAAAPEVTGPEAAPQASVAPADAAKAGEARSAGPVLSLAEVLASVNAHHPIVEAERATARAAEAEARAARGEFDTTLSVQGRAALLGYYDPRRLDVVVEQPTPFWGASVYAGYRITQGKVADYYGEYRTLDRGEVRGGARLPLWQDRGTDARRAGVAATRAQGESARQGYRELLLDMERDAASAYYTWLAAGQRMVILERLVALATRRDEQIRSNVALGALPAIERVDNRRAIFERERQLVMASRAFEKASLDLSLYYRDRAGAPSLPTRERLPDELSEPRVALADAKTLEAQALQTRPELKSYDASVAAARAERDLADNRVAPRLDVFGEASRDFGTADPALLPTLEPTVVEVGVSFSMPLWLRKARGKLDAADAKLRSLEEKASFARDKVQAEVRDAISQLRAARERVELARQGAEAALEVALGERERFELGASNLLFVNLREQTAADAEMALVDALAEAQIALARVITVSGEPLTGNLD